MANVNRSRLLLTFVVLAGSLSACAGAGGSYTQNIRAVAPAEGLDIDVAYEGTVFWNVSVRNNLPESVKLIWDESAYVTTDGSSSRLIRGNTQVMHLSQTQPASPIPPGASLKESFTAEAWADKARMAQKYGVSPKVTDPSKTGRMYIVFERGGKKISWEGEVAFVAASR